jgi:uncharacterized protein YxjI
MTDPLAPIAPQYKATEPTELILKEKKMSLSGDSATIKNKNGDTMFKVDAKMMSMSQRRTLLDAEGKTIGQLRKKKMPGIYATVYVGTESDEKKAAVVKKGLIDIMHDDADIKVDGKVVGEAKGNWRAKQFDIFINGNQVAHISRKTSLSSLVLDTDSYCIKIEPGVDQAFIALVAIALDELYHDED